MKMKKKIKQAESTAKILEANKDIPQPLNSHTMQEHIKKQGRPSKYDPMFDQMLIEHMSEGYSFESFAGLIEVNIDTLYEWVKTHKNFSEAKKIAVHKCRLKWESIGLKGTQGHFDGFAASSWMYNMKCRFKNEWLEPDKIAAPKVNAGKLIIDMSGTEKDDEDNDDHQSEK
jgi:hypothetical protein